MIKFNYLFLLRVIGAGGKGKGPPSLLSKFKKLDFQHISITYSSKSHCFFLYHFNIFLLISFENWPLFLVHPQNLSPTFRSIPTHLLIQCMSRHHPKVFVFSPDCVVFFRFLVKFLAYILKLFMFRDRKGQRKLKLTNI